MMIARICACTLVAVALLATFRAPACLGAPQVDGYYDAHRRPDGAAPVKLPFDRTCPVFHDNDDHRDVYTEEYLMALAHLGEIRLVGLTTTYAPNVREYDLFVQGRAGIVETARRSGLKNIPDALAATQQKLMRPRSNRPEETQPLNLGAAKALIAEARKATPEKPLVFLTGGQLTLVADAWLLAPDIAPRVVVAGLFGVPGRDYNASLDAWAWTIVVSNFRVLAVPFGTPQKRGTVFLKSAEVPKARIRSELPQDVPFFRWMFEKRHPNNPGPDEHDYDGQAAIALMRPDFITEVRRWRPEGILPNGDAKLAPDDNGPIIEAVDAQQNIATGEFWRAMEGLTRSLSSSRRGAANLVTGTTAPHYGVWQTELALDEPCGNPFFDVEVDFVFTLPDGSEVEAEGFYRGGNKWAGRAYCLQSGHWKWRSVANRPALDGRSGSFEVTASDLPGKLRQHPLDPRQFAYDNGRWFLHIGDTGYRYVTDTEPLWQQYIDEAAQVGFNKIRTWFCRGRHDVGALFTEDREGLDLVYWEEVERRLVYALENYPNIQFQLIPYGEDWPELRRYGEGDRAALLVARYAQARFSAFPNVQWCISNDSHISPSPGPRNAAPATIDRIGLDMRSREPWGTLLTNHQQRFQGYSFVDADWSDITTLEDRDQMAGAIILQYRELANGPVVLDEDRYGIYISPRHDRYFFRRLMWASLLSGGHATYGGLNTFEPFAGTDKLQGVQGYLTAVRDGRLDDGAADFKHIPRFFAEADLTLAGLQPNDAMAGNDGHSTKVIAGEKTIIAYLQNPDSRVPEFADVAETPAACRMHLSAGEWKIRWFDPRTGQWHDNPERREISGGYTRDFKSPFPGDAVLLLTR
jgi:inosine-uridine nucleoside N-ribohydrolase